MPPLSLPEPFGHRAPEIVIPSAGQKATLQSSGVTNGPLRLRVYRGGCSFGTEASAFTLPRILPILTRPI